MTASRESQEGNHPTDLFGFNTLRSGLTSKLQIPFQPKGLHDEMNSAAFDEFGRMTANLGLEAPNANPLLQNIILYPFVNPGTEFIDGTNLRTGRRQGQVPIASATDGTQIWKITHNGVDTHPIHFHLFDVQVLNRVTWDNIIIPTEPSELGWKDTVRISPLEDTIVALRPVVPQVPFEVPNSVRPLNPMMPLGDTSQFNPVDINGNPTADIVNAMVNFGWEYVYHCHILSHEEMDMMRPVTLALPPIAADGLARTITGNGNNQRNVISWSDNSINETSFVLQRSINGLTWADVGTSPSPLERREHARHPHPHRRDVQRDHRLPVPGRGQEHGRVRRRVPEHDRPVDLGVARAEPASGWPGGSHEPHCDTPGRPPGQPDVD